MSESAHAAVTHSSDPEPPSPEQLACLAEMVVEVAVEFPGNFASRDTKSGWSCWFASGSEHAWSGFLLGRSPWIFTVKPGNWRAENMLRRTFDPRKPHRYLRYGRMSDPQQNARSPEQQFDTVDSVVKRLGHPWIHVRDYRDDGISGRYLKKRTGYQQMLSDIKTGVVQVDLILVDTAERLGRVDELTAIRKDLYNRYGVLVLTATACSPTRLEPRCRALTMVETMRATEDGRIKAHNVFEASGTPPGASSGPGPPPFGLKLQSVLIDRNGRQEVDYCILVPDPETSWIIQSSSSRSHIKAVWGISRLAQGVQRDTDIPAQFKPFYPDTISYWLTNPIYHGELRWENHATGIVDDTRVAREKRRR